MGYVPYQEHLKKKRLKWKFIFMDIFQALKCQFHKNSWMIDVTSDRYDDMFKCTRCSREWKRVYYPF